MDYFCTCYVAYAKNEDCVPFVLSFALEHKYVCSGIFP